MDFRTPSPLRVGVFHPGTQHSWQTALALQQMGRLQWYATSIFYQPDKWPYRLERVLPATIGGKLGREFRRFSHPSLDPALVRTSGVLEWIERIASRAGQRQIARLLDQWGNARFVKGIAQDLRSSEKFAVWGYNGSSEQSFRVAKEAGRTCILDRTNGDFRVYNRLMAEIQETYGSWFLITERAEPLSHIERDQREYELADRILVGSPFCAGTIRDATSDPAIANKLTVLNYCYDEAYFGGLAPPRDVAENEPVKFLFLGLVIPRKGIHHLLEAIARIPRSAAELTIVGSMKVPPRAFAPYADRVNYVPTVARSEVPRIMSEHHVFLLPSYFEGAGITLYEALASGCALIQSDRCAPAVSQDTGIMLEDVSTEAVYAAMMTAIEDRRRLNAWRANAQAAAQQFTFARYRDNIAELLDTMGI